MPSLALLAGDVFCRRFAYFRIDLPPGGGSVYPAAMSDHKKRVSALQSNLRCDLLVLMAEEGRGGGVSKVDIAAVIEIKPKQLDDGIEVLVDAGLVRKVAECEYAITDSGMRAVAVLVDQDTDPPVRSTPQSQMLTTRGGFIPKEARPGERSREASRRRRQFGDGQGRPI